MAAPPEEQRKGAGGSVERTQLPAQPVLDLARANRRRNPQDHNPGLTSTLRTLDFTSGMRRLLLRATVFAFAVFIVAGAAMPALAAEAGPGAASSAWVAAAEDEKAPGPDTGPLQERALWSVLGIVVACGIGGVFYMLRRSLGHFANPTWIAPISIMLSKESPESYGDAPAEAHGSHH